MEFKGKLAEMRVAGGRRVARVGVLGLVAALLTCFAAVAIVWAAKPFAANRKRAAPKLSIKATPASGSVAAGASATFTLKIKPGTGHPKLKATGLPSGATASFKVKASKKAKLPASATMTVKTGASTPAGTYSVAVTGKSGAASGRGTVHLTVTADTPPPPPVEQPPSPKVFGVSAASTTPIAPGSPQDLDLLVQNLTTVEITIQGLTMKVGSVDAPQAAPGNPCTAADFTATQLGQGAGFSIPPGGSRKLSEVGIAPASRPAVALADRAVNQDGCRGATVTMEVEGTATGAHWTGVGSGAASAVVGAPASLALRAQAPVGQLVPGASARVDVMATNPNAYPLHISSLALDSGAGSGGFDVDPGHAGCALSALHFAPQNNGGAGWTVPAKTGGAEGSLLIEMPGAISMDATAANACQGATFTVHLKGGN